MYIYIYSPSFRCVAALCLRESIVQLLDEKQIELRLQVFEFHEMSCVLLKFDAFIRTPSLLFVYALCWAPSPPCLFHFPGFHAAYRTIWICIKY